jgi:hypothetical protein
MWYRLGPENDLRWLEGLLGPKRHDHFCKLAKLSSVGLVVFENDKQWRQKCWVKTASVGNNHKKDASQVSLPIVRAQPG